MTLQEQRDRVKPETPLVFWLNHDRCFVIFDDRSALCGHAYPTERGASNAAGVRSSWAAIANPFIELTTAVRAACEAAGIEVPEVQE